MSETGHPKAVRKTSGSQSNSDVKEWKGLFKKLGKDAQLRKALTDMGIVGEEEGGSAADTLHRILDAIKSGKIGPSSRQILPDYESCSSSEDEEEDAAGFADVGDPPIVTYDYDSSSVTKMIERVPEPSDHVFNPEDPLEWSERNGMGRILVTPTAEFFERHFEKKPLHECIKSDDAAGRFKDLLSEEAIFDLLSDKQLRYGQDVDVTIVGEDGVRQTLNPDGLVDAEFVKEKFVKDGCSIRLLHPQRFSDPLWSLMYKLECYWGSCVGCNAYLTPKGSHQGFAPHFDDIDAFVVQVSGKKKWRLYRAPDESLVLPRYSSRDFATGELRKPFWKGTLSAGDVLYLPRGMIHEASSVNGSNSLHVTISMNQRNNYFEFLTSLFSNALESCAKDSVAFRKTLPKGFLLSDNPEAEFLHDEFRRRIDKLLEGVFLRVNAQSTMCRAFSDFMLNRLPPPPDAHRFPESNKGAHTKVSAGVSVSLTYPQSAYAELDITGKTPALFVYHCLSNSRDLHQTLEGTEGAANGEDKVEPQLEVPLDCGPALHTLLSGQVLALSSEDMASESLSVIDLAQALVDAGILTVVPSPASKKRGAKRSRG